MSAAEMEHLMMQGDDQQVTDALLGAACSK